MKRMDDTHAPSYGLREAAGARPETEGWIPDFRPPRAERPAAATVELPGARAEGWRWGAARIIALAVAGLIAATFLNADHLLDRAEKKQFGSSRDFWVGVWTPVQEVSDTLYLNRPRRWGDRALGRELHASTFALPANGAGRLNAQVRLPDVTAQATADSAALPSAPLTNRRLPIPTASAPLRLWVGGDSMAAAFGESLSRLASATGVIAPELDARASTGLTRPDFFDWPGRLNGLVTNESPDVLVLIFGANDSQGLRTADGKVYQPGSDGWREDYRRRVAATMDLVAGEKRLVIWVGQPVMQSGSFSGRMAEMNAIYREEAARRPGILFFDSWPLFVGPHGEYEPYLTDDAGNVINARHGDGVHLTKAGADRLAAAVLARLNEETPIYP